MRRRFRPAMPPNLKPDAMGVVPVSRPERAMSPHLKVRKSNRGCRPGGGFEIYGYEPNRKRRS